MSYQVAIASYRRPDTIVRKTLKCLLEGEVPPENITVFVADFPEFQEYQRSFQVNDVPVAVQLEVGVLGLSNQRSFIHNFYLPNEPLVCIDDDVTKFVERYEDPDTRKPKLRNVEDVDALFHQAFSLLYQTDLNLGGWYPVPNAMFMKDKYTTDLRLIVGAAWFCINKHDPARTALKFGDDKEDHERTVRWFERDGGVLRINNVAAVTRYYKEPGGLQETRTQESVAQTVKELCEWRPEFFRPKRSHKGTMFPEVELKDRRAKK